jgi:hypothetical protein
MPSALLAQLDLQAVGEEGEEVYASLINLPSVPIF